MKKKWIAIGVGVLVVGGGAMAMVSGGGHEEGEKFTVVKAELELAVTEVGSLEPLRKIDIKSKIAGQVAEVAVDVGDKVKEGATLMRLRPSDADRELRAVQAQLQVNSAALDQAKLELVMKQKGHEAHAVSDLELMLASGAVKRFEAEAAVIAIDVQRARDQLGYTLITSPIDGTVLARNVQPGEMVTPGVASMVDGQPLLVVAQTESLLVRTELNQLDVAKVSQGQAAFVTLDALPGKTFNGKVHRVAAMAQKSERRKDSSLLVFPVDVIVPMDQEGAQAMKPGMMAEVRIPIETKHDVLAVPVEAIVREDGKTKLWKLTGDEGEKVDVVIGAQNDSRVEVLSGIALGDTIRLSPSGAERKEN